MAIKQAGVVALLLGLAFASSPSAVWAQGEGEAINLDDEGEGEGEGEGAGEGEGEGEGLGDEGLGDEGLGDDLSGDVGDMSDGLKELCELDPDSCVQIDFDEYAQREVEAEMYAVQQIWALRSNRFEMNLYGALTMNDQFVSHNGFGLAMNYYILHPLAVGINGNFYHGLNSQSDFNFETSRAARIGQPITEYSWNANVNLTYVPAYGKFAAFDNFIFHYDFYFLIGGGVISTRPIAVVDPDNRTFDYTIRPTWGFGGGIRIFFTRFLSMMFELRDYMFLDDLENPNIARGTEAQNPDTWLADDQSFTNNVQAQLGLSLFLPFSWEYELPK